MPGYIIEDIEISSHEENSDEIKYFQHKKLLEGYKNSWNTKKTFAMLKDILAILEKFLQC